MSCLNLDLITIMIKTTKEIRNSVIVRRTVFSMKFKKSIKSGSSLLQNKWGE